MCNLAFPIKYSLIEGRIVHLIVYITQCLELVMADAHNQSSRAVIFQLGSVTTAGTQRFSKKYMDMYSLEKLEQISRSLASIYVLSLRVSYLRKCL